MVGRNGRMVATVAKPIKPIITKYLYIKNATKTR